MVTKNEWEKRYLDLERDHEYFAYTIAHDLNAPIRHIKAFSKILLDSISMKVTPEDQESVDIIKHSSELLEKYLEGILEYSRLSNTQEPHKTLWTNDVIQGAIDRLNSKIEKLNAKVILPTSSYQIEGSEKRLVKAIFYILDNALKFHQEAKAPIIEIDVSQQNNQIDISFKDNGVGIDEAQIGRAFLMFKKSHLDDEMDGIGMGLPLAVKIIKAHNGEIDIESQKNKGTIVRFILPYTAKN